MSSESQAPFFPAWNGSFARLHKNEVTRNYPRGRVGFEICDGELETATQFVVGIGEKRIEWYARRGQPGSGELAERTPLDDWVVWLTLWPIDWTLDLSNRSLVSEKCLNWIWESVFLAMRFGKKTKLEDLLSCIIRIRCRLLSGSIL
jgi:hypothetical protein